MKYIITSTEDFDQEIFIFPRTINHDIMAESISRMKNQSHGNWKRLTRTPISAGFISNGVCYGKSESLNIKSRPEDTGILKLYLDID
jgi:hypothetical protein